MYKSTGLRSQIWWSMHNTHSAILAMLEAINSVMDSEWSDWVASQCSVVACSNHHWIKPLACVVVKFWTTRGFIYLDLQGESFGGKKSIFKILSAISYSPHYYSTLWLEVALEAFLYDEFVDQTWWDLLGASFQALPLLWLWEQLSVRFELYWKDAAALSHQNG